MDVFRREFDPSCRGTSLANWPHMSPVGQALEEHFDTVCRSELERLHKKTAALAPEHRAQVHALTLELAQRMALRLDAALTETGDELEAVAMRLFGVTTSDGSTTSTTEDQ